MSYEIIVHLLCFINHAIHFPAFAKTLLLSSPVEIFASSPSLCTLPSAETQSHPSLPPNRDEDQVNHTVYYTLTTSCTNRPTELDSAMATTSKAVSADPFQASQYGACFACGENNKKRPAKCIMLTEAAVRKRAKVNTDPLANPFTGHTGGEFFLCTTCRSPKVGWAIMSDDTRPSKAKPAIQLWKSRVKPTAGSKSSCYICEHLKRLGKIHNMENIDGFLAVNSQLHCLNIYDDNIRQNFCRELCRRSGMEMPEARFLLYSIPTSKFCSLHRNQTRHSLNHALSTDPSLCGAKHGYCVFRDRGCVGKNSVLRPLPFHMRNTLEEIETFVEFNDRIASHSGDQLCADDISGKQACASCRYVITGGAQGLKPKIDQALLKNAVDRCLIDCVMYALQVTPTVGNFLWDNAQLRTEAEKLRTKVLAPFPSVPSSRFLPITDLARFRTELLTYCGDACSNVTVRTLESRLGPFFAAKNVLLFSLSKRLRCYANKSALANPIHDAISLSVGDEFSLSPKQRRSMLAQVSKRFIARKEDYRRGRWILSEEIRNIPSTLWGSFALDMASQKQLASMKLRAVAAGKSICYIFPASNLLSATVANEIDDFAQLSLSKTERPDCLSRESFLLCIRILKVIEQVIYARSRVSVGPLTMTTSIAGIAESSASWTSVLHALGMVTSYDYMESYRKTLIVEREGAERGAFDGMNLSNRVVSIQIDNFDILPFHSVKDAGKALPMISGTVTQSLVQSRKQNEKNASREETSASTDKEWLQPDQALISRESFISSLHDNEDQSIFGEFCDLAFGIAYEHREQLMGNSNTAGSFSRAAPRRQKYSVDFRTLLLSCFKPHGGLDVSHPSLYNKDVCFVDISRMSAADSLTIHRKLALIKGLLKPGEVTSPRYVVVSGDQPTYRMIVKIWRSSFLEARRTAGVESIMADLRIHEWVIPFPGFFHIEKQSLHALCKEMLHGMGLKELANCAGLTQAQVDNILKHGHARNNRSTLTSVTSAILIHCTDVLLADRADVKEHIEEIKRKSSSGPSCSSAVKKSKLLQCTTDKVTDLTILIGRKIREQVLDHFCCGPNGKHIINTVLLTCLLPTLGFHVLSRTGHTDLVDSFWLRLSNVMHTSGHLKYQELFLFYGFFKSIMPRVVLRDLFFDKPGSMVGRIPSFTSGLKHPYDFRGWTYVHLDESLEMLIVRLVKSLNHVMLQHLETAAAWLLCICNARTFIRCVTGATRVQHRVSSDRDTEVEASPLDSYNRYAIQSDSVRSMVRLMKQKDFLGMRHRMAPTLQNVLGSTVEHLNDDKMQSIIISIEDHGKKSAELHAAAMFPELFGRISDYDIKEFFDGKRFKGQWTKMRQVKTIGEIMEGTKAKEKSKAWRAKNPLKSLAERRLVMNKVMTSLSLAQNALVEIGDLKNAERARRRWEMLHEVRYLMSPLADAYRSAEGGVRHSQKSKFITAMRGSNEENADGLGEERSTRSWHCVHNYYEYHMPTYAALMVDIMNHIWTRSADGRRGTSLFCTTVMKMKDILRPWFSGRRSSCLKQVHLHIDDPSLVIQQKRGEQQRRDGQRGGVDHTQAELLSASRRSEQSMSFQAPLSEAWSALTEDRKRRDYLCSLHLFCAGVAALELAREKRLDVVVYLHGGCFCFNAAAIGYAADKLLPEVSNLIDACEIPREGEVMLCFPKREDGATGEILQVPRSRALIVSDKEGLQVAHENLLHGEGETRFVASYEKYVSPMVQSDSDDLRSQRTLVVSTDTDVTVILSLAETLRGRGVIHVMGHHIIEIDSLHRDLRRSGLDARTLAMIYVLAGCDFTPGTFGVTHEHYLGGAVRFQPYIMAGMVGDMQWMSEMLTITAYLEKQGLRTVCTVSSKKAKQNILARSDFGSGPENVKQRMRQLFASDHSVGSEQWFHDVRRLITDNAKSAAELIPPQQHIHLQGKRACFIVTKYWLQANHDILTPNSVDGCNLENGFGESGEIILERKEDVETIIKAMQELVAKCGCKGSCNNGRCSCVRRQVDCLGCDCVSTKCENRLPVTAYVPDLQANNDDTGNGEKELEEEEEVDGEEEVSVELDWDNCLNEMSILPSFRSV